MELKIHQFESQCLRATGLRASVVSCVVIWIFVSTVRAEEPPSFLKEWYQLKNEIRTSLATAREPKYGFEFLRPREIAESKAFDFRQIPEKIVLVLGGLQTNRNAAELLASQLSWRSRNRSNLAMYAVFDYPNDGSIEESGSVLRAYLQTLQLKAPHARVSIVSHSMGGLIARYALEIPDKQSAIEIANVDKLVMICPPNHGSILAQYADALELADFLSRAQEKGFSLDTIVESLLHDGMGEACDDLVPGSVCLTKLNSRPRAKGVHYSMAVGTGGPITPTQRLLASILVDQMKSQFKTKTKNLDWFVKKGEELLNCEELTHGLGDGAVSRRSTELTGVEDKAVFAIHHVQWIDAKHPEVQRLHEWICERVH
jgi:hypothetical protein